MYDGLQLNKGNLARFGVGPGSIVDIAHGGTGASNATDALRNLGVPVFSALNYGAVADGDGRGNGSDNTDAITAVLTAASNAGGGVALVPFSGTNTYNMPGLITGDFSNVTLLGEGGSTLDVTGNLPPSTPTIDIDYSIQTKGTIGAAILFTAQVVPGSSVLPLASVDSIVPGTILQITSTISSLSADILPGTWDPADVVKWRLGNSTSGLAGFVPYSEFVTVKSVSGLNATLTAPVQWKYPILRVPSYNTVGPAVSAARIVTPVTNFWVRNLNFTRYDATQQTVRGVNIVQMIAAQNSGIAGGTYHLAQRRGAAGNFICCIDTLQEVGTTHTVGYDPSLQHDIYNSGKFKGCLRHTVVLDDLNGSQGADESYVSASQAPYNTINMFCTITGKARDNLDGSTSHGGSYGLTVRDFTAINCGRMFYNRAAYSTIRDSNAYNSNDPDDGTLTIAPFATNVTVSNVNLYGAPHGIQIERKVLDEIAPCQINAKFSNVNAFDIVHEAARLIEPTTETNAVTISVASPAVVTQAGGSGAYYGCPITFTTTGTLPTGLALNTLYYVLTKLSDSSYTISASVGGAAIVTTVAGSGTHSTNWQSAASDPCGIGLSDCKFERVNKGVVAEAYYNYVEWRGGSMELTGTAPVGFQGLTNSIGHTCCDTTFYDNDATAIGFQFSNPTGTVGALVFPTATYPTSRLNLGDYGSNSNRLVGLGAPTAINSIRGLYNFQAGSSYIFQPFDVFQTVWCTRTTTTQALVIAIDGTGAGQIQWQDGACIQIVVAGTAIAPSISADVSITVDAPQGLVIPPGATAYLKRRATNSWALWISTSAQIVGASYIDVRATLGGSDTADPAAALQAFYDSGAANGKHLIYKGNWLFQTRPVAVGPQGQYLTPPQFGTHEWANGALWDFSAYAASTSIQQFFRREGSLDTARVVTGAITGGVTVTMTVTGFGLTFARDDRVLLRASNGFDDLSRGAYTLADAQGISITSSLSGTTLTVTVVPLNPDLSETKPISVGSQITGAGVTANTLVTAFLTGIGGTGTYTVSISQTVGSEAMLVWRGFNAKAEGLIVQSSTTNTVTFFCAPEFDYPTTAAPVLQRYLNEPQIGLINPCALGPGRAASKDSRDRFAFFGACRNITIEGGRLADFGTTAVRILSSLGGRISDLQVIGPEVPGVAPNGSTAVGISDDTTDFLVENCLSWGTAQPWNLAGSAYMYGISKRITFRGVTGNGAANTFGTHNLSEQILFDECISNGTSGAAFDVRCASVTIRGGEVNNSGAGAAILRIAPNNFVCDGLRVDTALSGIAIDEDSTPAWDVVPNGFTAINNILQNIGGTGSHGAFNFSYGLGARPVLGWVKQEGNFASTNDNTPAYVIKGKWTAPVQRGNRAEGYGGASPSGQAFWMGAPPGFESTGEGPASPIQEDNSQTASFSDPLIQFDTGRSTQLGNMIDGITSSYQTPLATSATLRGSQVNMSFNNTGATGLVTVTLPSASRTRQPIGPFYVSDADGFKIQVGVADTVQIGTGAPGALGGSITATTVGAWCLMTAIGSVKWIAQVDDPANWTVA